MKFKIKNILIIFLIIIINILQIIKCDDDHNVCNLKVGDCNDSKQACLWSQVCKDITSNSNIQFNSLNSIYIILDRPVIVNSIKIFETQINVLSNSGSGSGSNSNSNSSLTIIENLTIQPGGVISINSITFINIINLNNQGSFKVDQSNSTIISGIIKNTNQFIISDSNLKLSGDIEFESKANFINSNIEINSSGSNNCIFRDGINSTISGSGNGNGNSTIKSSTITFIDTCELLKESNIISINQNGPDPIKLSDESKLIINGLFNCNSQHLPCIIVGIKSNITFQINDENINSYGNSGGINLDIKGIQLNSDSKLIIGGDLDNELQYSLVKLSKIWSASNTIGKIILNDISKLYQLTDINSDGSITDIIIEDGTTSEIKSSKLHSIQIHSGGQSKLLISDSSIYNGQLNISNTDLEIGNGVSIDNSIIAATKNSLITIKSNSFNVMESTISTQDSIRIVNTEIMTFDNSSITIYNKNNLISDNSYITPTGSSNFTVNKFYLNGNSKLEVDHSNHDSNFTIYGELIASEKSTIGLKQLGKLSPHLIVTGNLTAGGCNLEILFDSGTEDLHAEYTILESQNFINNFNQITVYNGDQLIKRDYYQLIWRGKLCYLLNDVDLDRDFANSTINGWTIITVLIILIVSILLFSFYKFTKNKFKKSTTTNKYEPLEMTDLEKI